MTVFLKSASFVSFTDKNFKCLTEIKILSVRMSVTKIQDIQHRTRTCLTSLKSFQEVCYDVYYNTTSKQVVLS